MFPNCLMGSSGNELKFLYGEEESRASSSVNIGEVTGSEPGGQTRSNLL